jgi:hypothetical protein
LDFVFQLAIEVGIGFIPVVGFLYEIGQLAYMLKHGEDFFGNEVMPTDVAVVGAFAAVGVAFKGSKILTKALKGDGFPLDIAVIDQLADTVNQRGLASVANATGQAGGLAIPHVGNSTILKALAGMSDDEQARLINALSELGTSVSRNADAILKLRRIQHGCHTRAHQTRRRCSGKHS